MTVDLAVVPVAGRGTRMLPITKSQPKEMVPVGTKPVVQYVAEELEQSGVRRMVLVTGPGKTAIENHFDIDAGLIASLRENGNESLLDTLSFERMQLEYIYMRQRHQLGLGHAIMCARPVVVDQPFIVALGDSIIGVHAESKIVANMTEVFEREDADGIIALQTVPRAEVVRYGIASVAEDNGAFLELADLVEKPTIEEAPSQLAVAARYVFKAKLFDYLEKTRQGKGNEIQLTDAISMWIKDGGRILGMVLDESEPRFDIGNFPSYFRAFFEFAISDPEHGSDFRDFVKRRMNEALE